MTDASDQIATAQTFPNILAVVDYLRAYGWKVGKSIAYQHRNDGKIKPREDGIFYQKDVDKYARTFLRRHDTGMTISAEYESVQQEKSRAEADKLKAQAEHWQIKTAIARGLYVEKDQFERELARRAAVFKADIENFIRAQAVGIISLVSGDGTKAPDLIEHMLDQAESWLNRYSSTEEFTVPLPQPTTMSDDDEGIEDDDDDDDYDLMETQKEGVAEI
ncbi:MAG TPA: hypothetical protein DDY86_02545 [Syntrophaceae bacterium]|nr:hypothetical protein [Syntrophaceae bacterium]